MKAAGRGSAARPHAPWPVCYHEAGHAVMAVVLRLGLRFVLAHPTMRTETVRGTVLVYNGRTSVLWPPPARRRRKTWRRRFALFSLAGHLARDEWRPCSLGHAPGAWSDLLQTVWAVGLRYGPRPRYRTVIRRQTATLRPYRREARALLRRHWPAVAAVARELRRRGRLASSQVSELVRVFT